MDGSIFAALIDSAFLIHSRSRRRKPEISEQKVRPAPFETLEHRVLMSTAPTVTNVVVDGTAWSSSFTSYLATLSSANVNGYSIPVGSSAQLNALPWNNINQISISFSQDVDVVESDLQLLGVNTSTYSFSGFNYNSTTDTATWTLPSAITDDKLVIDLSDGITNASGTELAGSWSDGSSSYPSGSGTTSNFTFSFNVLSGDVNHSNGVNAIDLNLVQNQIGQTPASSGYNLFADLNASGGVNAIDLNLVQNKIGQILPSSNPILPTAIDGQVNQAILAEVTADNHYGLYYGAADGSNLTPAVPGGARNETGPGGSPGSFNWSDAENWNFAAPPGDYLYVVAWDAGGDQAMFTGEFDLPNHAPLLTNPTDWQYVTAGTNPGENGALPSTSTIATQIDSANSSGWNTPFDNEGQTNGTTIPEISKDANPIWTTSYTSDLSTNSDDYVIFRAQIPTYQSGVAGVTVYLDTNNNSVLDSGEPTTTTDSRGHYSFSGLTGGTTYHVNELVPNGAAQLTPTPGTEFSVTPTSGQTIDDIDFLITQPLITFGGSSDQQARVSSDGGADWAQEVTISSSGSVTLDALGSTRGAQPISYTWQAVGTQPGTINIPSSDGNGHPIAHRISNVTFSAPGTYTLDCVISDASGNSATSDLVTVIVT